jgi:hypothetical protein
VVDARLTIANLLEQNRMKRFLRLSLWSDQRRFLVHAPAGGETNPPQQQLTTWHCERERERE